MSPDATTAGPELWQQAAAAVWLPTAAEMATLDRRAAESGATTERTLIEAAGREVARQVQARWPRGTVVGLLGSGHNGADGMVALRTLRAWGRDVRGVVCGSSPPDPDVTAGWDVPLEPRDSFPDPTARDAAVVLDALLGTGVTGAPREPQASVIRSLNGLGVPVAAVDGPSGVDFTDGSVPGACVRADLTVSLGWPKLGLLLPPAREACGELVGVEIGFPPLEATLDEPAGARAVTGRWVREMLRRRGPTAHKGEAGYLTLVAGQEGMAGASVLAARAACRGGAGVVRVVGAPGNREIVQTAIPDAVFQAWDDPDGVGSALGWCDAVAMGPGLGRGPERRELVARVLEGRGDRPLLLDADGLNAVGSLEELAEGLGSSPALLTPHPGELARLVESDPPEVAAAPVEHARAAARRAGHTVLLKGAPSVVAEPSGALRVATAGGPEVASGGSGDVLSGVAGAYLAAGLAPADAAAAALFVSGVAAARSPVPEGHLASDVPDRLPAVRREVEELAPTPAGPVVFALPSARR